MAKKKVGRKEWLPTPQILSEVRRLASQGLTKEQIAHCIHIGPSTFFEKLAKFPELVEAVNGGASEGIEKITNVLFNLAQGGNFSAVSFYLKCRANWKENDQSIIVTPKLTLTVDGKKVEMD